LRFSTNPLNAVWASAAAPTDQPPPRSRPAAVSLGLQILDAQNLYAVDHTRRDAPDLTGVLKPYASQQLTRCLGDAAQDALAM
jgi:hypothetical protein